jgi:hypothetical protein
VNKNGVARKILGTEAEEIRDCRKQYNNHIHYLRSSSNAIRVIHIWSRLWTGLVARMEDGKKCLRDFGTES